MNAKVLSIFAKDFIMAYVYRHVRHDTNQPYYIGIGSVENYARAFTKVGRNKIWYDISSKTTYDVEIMFDNISWEEACAKEIEFIALYGRICDSTGVLCNLTLGGDGANGLSQESRDKLRDSRLGKKLSNETKNAISKVKKGNNNRGITVVNNSLEISLPNGRILADLIGVNRKTLCTWLNGKFKSPEWFDWEYRF